jgi:hypothetical protein
MHAAALMNAAFGTLVRPAPVAAWLLCGVLAAQVPTWSVVNADTATIPVGSVVTDTQRNRLVAVGTYYPQTLSILEWNGSLWERRAGNPGGVPLLAYDSLRGRTLMLSSSGATSFWDGNSLTSVSTATQPVVYVNPALAYDSARDRVILFGGAGPGGVYSNQWEWNGTDWAFRSPPHAPNPRACHAISFDPLRGRLVLFGGRGVNDVWLDDTWEWDGVDWQLPGPAHRPPARGFHGMCWDSVRARTLVSGGRAAHSFGDTWEWDGVDWTNVATATVATNPLQDTVVCGLGFDAAHQQAVLLRSVNSQPFQSQIWLYDHVHWTRAPFAMVAQPDAIAYDPVRGRAAMFAGGLAEGETW